MNGTRAVHRRGKKYRLAVTAVLSVAALAGAIGVSFATGATHSTTKSTQAAKVRPPAPLSGKPQSLPSKGMVYAGLTVAPVGNTCVGMYTVSKADLCTHGPDAPPQGVDIHKLTPPVLKADKAPQMHGDAQQPSVPLLLQDTLPVMDARTGTMAAAAPSTAAAPPAGTAVVCDGDGSTGNRVQVLYMHAPGNDRFAQYQGSFKKWAADADVIYNASAQETGGTRHIRFVTEPDCTASVLDVEVPASSLADFGASNNALAAKGFNRRDRKYMIFGDAQVYCGIGTFDGDEQAGPGNRSNFGPSYGRDDSGCWSGSVSAHELGHNLGAVNNSAPHSSKAGHCVDEWDLMCYSDAPYYPKMQDVCHDRGEDARLDCNHDDYYNTNPAPGSYLATHWNVANNTFLIAGGGNGGNPNPSPTPTPTSTPTSTPTATPTPSPTPTPDPTKGPDAKAGQVTQNSAAVSWTAVASASDYALVVNGSRLGFIKSTSVRLINLRAGTAYSVAVVTRDRAGHISAPGRAATFRTLAASTATPRPGTRYLMLNSLTGQAADMFGGSTRNGDVLIGYQRHGYANQQWQFTATTGGYLTIKSALSGKCLQAGGRPTAGQNVVQQTCGTTASQLWKLTATSAGYTLTPKGTSFVLGLSDHAYYGSLLLQLQKPVNKSYQNWTLQAVA